MFTVVPQSICKLDASSLCLPGVGLLVYGRPTYSIPNWVRSTMHENLELSKCVS